MKKLEFRYNEYHLTRQDLLEIVGRYFNEKIEEKSNIRFYDPNGLPTYSNEVVFIFPV